MESETEQTTPLTAEWLSSVLTFEDGNTHEDELQQAVESLHGLCIQTDADLRRMPMGVLRNVVPEVVFRALVRFVLAASQGSQVGGSPAPTSKATQQHGEAKVAPNAPESKDGTLSAAVLEQAFKELSQEAQELYLPTVVDHITEPSAVEFYRNYVAPNVPVIIKDACAHWPAMSRWTDEYLSEKMGDSLVTVAVTPKGMGDCVHDDVFVLPEERRMRVAEFVKILRGESDELEASADSVFYIQHQNGSFTSEYGPLADDIHELEWAREAFGSEPDAVNFWMGDNRAVSSMHKDPYENIYCVVSGSKTFTLVPPTDWHWVGGLSHRFKVGQFCEKRTENGTFTGDFAVDMLDEERDVSWIPVDPVCPATTDALYPEVRFDNAHVLQVEVHAGEALFLPSLWFHRVAQSSPDPPHGRTIAVNFWYDMQFDIRFAYHEFLKRVSAATTSAPKTNP